MIPPSRRIWLYPDRSFTRPRNLEIIVLGEIEAVASVVVDIRTHLERWQGFEGMQSITMGDQLLGFRVTRGKLATHDDPVAEAMLMLRRFPIEWYGDGTGAMVGYW